MLLRMLDNQALAGDQMPEGLGLVIVHTGNGKGKTTAALGMGMRSWGQGLKVLVMQFIKSSCTYVQLGLGFRYSAFFRLGDSPDAEEGGCNPR
jgi:ATP:corrinoid adenosyltransferase